MKQQLKEDRHTVNVTREEKYLVTQSFGGFRGGGGNDDEQMDQLKIRHLKIE